MKKKKIKPMQLKVIKKETNISDIVRKHPEAADVFANYGLHCIGCSMSSWESIEQGAFVHGMDKKTTDNMIKELNDYVSQKEEKEDKNPIKITSRAADQVLGLMKKSKDSKYLRIAIVKVPFGQKYGFKFEKTKKKNDIIIEKNKTLFVINKKDLSKIRGSTLDYISYMPGNGFKVYPPMK